MNKDKICLLIKDKVRRSYDRSHTRSYARSHAR